MARATGACVASVVNTSVNWASGTLGRSCPSVKGLKSRRSRTSVPGTWVWALTASVRRSLVKPDTLSPRVSGSAWGGPPCPFGAAARCCPPLNRQVRRGDFLEKRLALVPHPRARFTSLLREASGAVPSPPQGVEAPRGARCRSPTWHSADRQSAMAGCSIESLNRPRFGGDSGVPWVQWSRVVGFSCCGAAGVSSFELDGGEHAER